MRGGRTSHGEDHSVSTPDSGFFHCNLISRGQVNPKSPKLTQTVSNKIQLWTSIFNEISEKEAGSFVGQIPFSSWIQPSGLQRRCVHEPDTAAGACW